MRIANGNSGLIHFSAPTLDTPEPPAVAGGAGIAAEKAPAPEAASGAKGGR